MSHSTADSTFSHIAAAFLTPLRKCNSYFWPKTTWEHTHTLWLQEKIYFNWLTKTTLDFHSKSLALPRLLWIHGCRLKLSVPGIWARDLPGGKQGAESHSARPPALPAAEACCKSVRVRCCTNLMCFSWTTGKNMERNALTVRSNLKPWSNDQSKAPGKETKQDSHLKWGLNLNLWLSCRWTP